MPAKTAALAMDILRGSDRAIATTLQIEVGTVSATLAAAHRTIRKALEHEVQQKCPTLRTRSTA
jgi:DNA-directed RNA polymerase specialized sigma24 family protein